MNTKITLYICAIAAIVIMALVGGIMAPRDARSGYDKVLKAKPWNDGKVHVWATVNESDQSFTDLPEGTLCQRLTQELFKLEDGGPPIYYYQLQCGDVIGYVEIDQAE